MRTSGACFKTTLEGWNEVFHQLWGSRLADEYAGSVNIVMAARPGCWLVLVPPKVTGLDIL